MKFNLVESIEDNIWYHISDKLFTEFKSNWQGIHFADSIKGAKYVMENRNATKGNLYIVKLQNLVPLYIDADPMSWGAKDIAKLFIAKINNTEFAGASGEELLEDEGNYKYNLSPDLININNLEETDLEFLNTIKNNDIESFNKIAEFIETKGFNSIIYPLAEDKKHKSKSVIIWDTNLIQSTFYKPNIKI